MPATDSPLFAGAARVTFGDVPIVASTPSAAVAEVLRVAPGLRQGEHVHLANAYTIALADTDAGLSSVLSSGVCLPDGKPLTWLSRLRRRDARLVQTRGPQFFLDVIDRGRSIGIRHYLLGGSEQTLARLERQLRARYPGVEITGAYSPPFRALTEDEVAMQDAAIRASGAQVVWVGLGTPKQDFECARIASTMPVIAAAVGAAFDFTAGNLRRAPRWMSWIGLEWLHRLIQEPRRLWRRYLFGNLRFLRVAVRSHVRS